MTQPQDCPHPDDARMTTGKGIEKCAACGLYNPDVDLERRRQRRDTALAKGVRAIFSDYTPDEKILEVLTERTPPVRQKTFKSRKE